MKRPSELVQLKLNIEASDGDSTPPEVYEESTPTYRSGGLENQINGSLYFLTSTNRKRYLKGA